MMKIELTDTTTFGAGFSKRELLAALFAHGIICASGDSKGDVDYQEEAVARNAIKMADTLIAELGE